LKQLVSKVSVQEPTKEQFKEIQNIVFKTQSKLLQFTINTLAHVSKLKANTDLF